MLSNFKNKPKSKINDVIIKNIPIVAYKEILLNNVIEEDLQSVLKPLDLMQKLFICAKYSIRDNFITSNSSRYNFLGLICALIFRSLVFYNLIISIYQSNGSTTTLNCCYVYDFFLFSIGFILNYFSNIIQGNNNVLLVLKIQHVLRVLKIDGKYLKSLALFNWIYVILLNFIYILSTIFFWVHFSPDNIIDFLSSYSGISFDINIVYASFFINLMRKMLSVWIKEMRMSRNIQDLDSESHWKIMFDVYVNILKAYKIFEKTFRLLVVYYTVHTVCHGLMNVVIILQMKQLLTRGTGEFALFAVISQMWLVKSTALQILLCIESEKFYSTMDEVQSVCMYTLLKKSRGCSDTQKRVLKNIQRQQITSFNKMNAFGLFVIDATLPLQIYSVVTTYTLTLLQFNLS